MEQLIFHAEALAALHPVGATQKSNPLLERLGRHEVLLRRFLQHTQEDPSSARRLTPAAEWLLDNFYLIEEQIQLARKHLPRHYSRELPCLLEGKSAGLPRVYDVVSELVFHQDAQVDAESLSAFVAAYQRVTALKLGELWAIPIMLRLCLIDTLQQMAQRLLAAREDRALANAWIERLQTMVERNPSQWVVVVAEMAKSEIQFSCAFVAEFTEQLARQNPLLHLARSWLEQHLLQEGQSVEALCTLENQQQAANQITVSHCIGSLRFLSTMDWEEFVETLSGVEEILRGDPARVYRRMDFATRDRYRHAVESLARQSRNSEKAVAEEVLRLSADHARTFGAEDRRAHVGFVLIDKGLPALRRSLRARASGFSRLEAAILRRPLRTYLGALALFTLAICAGFVCLATRWELPAGLLVLSTVLVVLCGGQLSVSLVNALTPLLLKPRPLPRLDFSKGIDSECRSIIVIPCMLTTPEGVQSLLDTLELHHLPNADPHLHVALLSDYRDAGSEHQPGDEALLRAAAHGVDRLNQKYAASHPAPFFLFHRPRVWNVHEGVWMGIERKRGKLEAFNTFLRGGSRSAYSGIRGDFFAPQGGRLATLFAVTLLGLPGLLSALASLFCKSNSGTWRQHLRAEGQGALRLVGQILFTLAMLPYESQRNLDAIFRTLFRVFVSHKHLLEWQTSGDAALDRRERLLRHFHSMAFSPLLAFATAGILARWVPANLPGALPLLLLWVLAPWLAWKCSQPIVAKAPKLSPKQLNFLGQCARKTWSFFETFVTADEHWLPPDNFQEAHGARIASRTSPTNIGLSLLANLAARDFGYLSLNGLVRRTQDTFATLDRLPRKHGHFFNWYDTRSLEPLLPIYLSSVDSGNLAGHLLTLSSALRSLPDDALFSERIFSGLRDTLHVLMELTPGANPLRELEQTLTPFPETFSQGMARLELVREQIARMSDRFAEAPHEQQRWFQRLQHDAEAQFQELRALGPDPSGPAHPTLRQQAVAGHPAAIDLLQALDDLALRGDAFAAMDFNMLYDPARELFRTGYNLSERRFDIGYYDLLASEARLGSYVAIALGQVPQEHWFTLGRLLVSDHSDPLLVSWSGSMFEYLMPMLIMPSYEQTLLDHSCRAAVEHQIAYGQLRKVPWGISESGYNRTDTQLNYQYRAFGSPGIGLKRGLAEDLVIAPYASVMALMISPRLACENLQRLRAEGREGAYGFYEAIDYTPTRQLPSEKSCTIQSYMAHHQGMSLLALLHFLRNKPMQKRFMECPPLRATGFLLQERVPSTAASVHAGDLLVDEPNLLSADKHSTLRVMSNPTPVSPEVHLLSNGRYHVLISSAGAGSSRWRDLAVTRWHEDGTRDPWGFFVYIRDVDSGERWSATHQPTRVPGDSHEAIFSQARAEFKQLHHRIAVHTEICVSPEDDVEVRRITLTNHSRDIRHIELTSYAEVVLAPAAADAAHPAFSNLFVQTEFNAATASLLCTRRPRSVDEIPPWLLHLFVGQNNDLGEVRCETDRARFIGRGGTLVHPRALHDDSPLSNTVGSVLDPVVSLRRVVTLPPRESRSVYLVLGVCESRDLALARVQQYQSPRMADRAFDLAWTHSQVTLHHLNITEVEAQLYGRLTSALVYADPARRAPASMLSQNRRGQTGLWSYGISGDAPIVLLFISDSRKIELAEQAIRAHAYWRSKGLAVELVILNGDRSVYHQSLHQQITERISSGVEAPMLDQRGGIFVRQIEQIPQEDLVLLQAAARVILHDDNGSFQHQAERQRLPEPGIPLLFATAVKTLYPNPPEVKRDLLFHNGHGGFTRDGREYVITLQPGQHTPAPWINVIANRSFGTVVSESGGGYTWIENAHAFRITPWNNDSVRDTPGEAFYLRDEHSGQVWSPTPGPARGKTPYTIRHGFGYSVFEHQEHGIRTELWIYVAPDAPVKFATLHVSNVSGQSRRLSATGYWEWVLGDLRAKSLMHVQTEIDPKSGALFARNTYNNDFMGRIAFLDVNEPQRSLTADRKEFIGRNGCLSRPAALTRSRLSGNVGAGLDPCGVLQVGFDLADGQSREITFRLGVGRDKADAATLLRRYRQPQAARKALEGVWDYWSRTLGAVNLDTPDPAVNLMANGWLLYQTLSCRMWGRSGFYQSGGAYGFRDQLQDSLALVHSEPALIRGHLLLAAAHQFREGDVQHWWHPPGGRGVRTHFSDDFLWLPFVTCHYVRCVGDSGVLDEAVPFLEGRPVPADEEAYFDQPNVSDEKASLYEHCVRAIDNGLRFGEHGLPLIGCGDWNDGMNKVGPEGKGESVWLAFFLFDVLTRFAQLADARKDSAFALKCREQADKLRENIETHAWDGGWYKRAWFDNGRPLGSAQSPECQIDSIPQSWAVLSGAGDPERSRAAMEAVDQRLVRRDVGLIQLFDPPFDNSDLNPGYIKGYIPGVRENGGQYTHAAIWTAMAFAKLGDSDRAWELFHLLNPIHHGDSPEAIATYKVEPYVAAADIYGVTPHVGRGGWTWYTGSAGWMYRLLVETLLGIQKQGDQLHINPQLPKSWDSYKLHYRYLQTVYHITILRDPSAPPPEPIQLLNDRQEHHVEITVR